MTWVPCQRVVRADIPLAFRIRGIEASAVICWPDTTLNGSSDYSIDFGALLCCGDRIVEVEFITGGGQIAWSSVFGTLATAWIVWFAPGPQTVVATVRTSSGQVLTVSVGIAVQPIPSLIPPELPPYAPNAFLLGPAIVPDAYGNPLIFG
ncbi:hypothetical protein JK202_10875 [Gluconobacter sp. Dm-62]|uniref:phage fiber-tail adaptor protein n=1 Tax=Gluconobacter sp. Dm-62 TaxID=2799804 RepID=UPI001B8D74BC|nr:hypothetical protein [Gluconobacter sp. Dm-62]MBS1103512.1 hypothetical protein [Gluconobacter sp. Dm-62]